MARTKSPPDAATDSPKQGLVSGASDSRVEISQILHKLNQPLTAINNYAQAGSYMLENGVPDLERLKELFTKIASQSARSFEISQELRKATAIIKTNQDQNL